MGEAAMNHDVENALRTAVEELVAAGHPCEVGSHGTPPEDGRIRFVIEGTPPTRIVRPPHITEGREAEEFDLSRQRHPDELRAWVDELRGLLEADAAIVEAGGDPLRAGTEHHVAHPLVLKAAQAYGWTPGELAEPMLVHLGDRWIASRSSHGSYTPMLSAEGDGFHVTFERILRRRRVLCERMLFATAGGGRSVEIAQNTAGLRMIIRGMAPPDTVLEAMAGRRIGDVIDWSALSFMADEPIASAHVEGGGMRTQLVIDLASGTAALPAKAW
jgi:hypothetical protein